MFDTAFFVNGKPDVEEINLKTLGLHLDPPPGQQRPNLKIADLPDYAKSVAEAYLQAQVDYFEHSPCDIERTVRIDNLGIGTTDFNLTPEQKAALIRSGFDHTCRYLQKWRQDKLAEVCKSARPSRSPR